jgi:hypothetical protein
LDYIGDRIFWSIFARLITGGIAQCMNLPEFNKLIAARKREKREAVKVFVQGARTGDRSLFGKAIELVERPHVWREAFRAVAKYSAPMDIRSTFAESWLSSGDHIRCEVSDDLVLIPSTLATARSRGGEKLGKKRSGGSNRCICAGTRFCPKQT